MKQTGNSLQLLDMEFWELHPDKALLILIDNYAWILTVLMLICIVSGISRIRKAKKQNKDEQDIKNMFNEDGTKNMHYAHKDYDPLPCFIFAMLLFVVRLLAAGF